MGIAALTLPVEVSNVDRKFKVRSTFKLKNANRMYHNTAKNTNFSSVDERAFTIFQHFGLNTWLLLGKPKNDYEGLTWKHLSGGDVMPIHDGTDIKHACIYN